MRESLEIPGFLVFILSPLSLSLFPFLVFLCPVLLLLVTYCRLFLLSLAWFLSSLFSVSCLINAFKIIVNFFTTGEIIKADGNWNRNGMKDKRMAPVNLLRLLLVLLILFSAEEENWEIHSSDEEDEYPFACHICRNEFTNPVVTKYYYPSLYQQKKVLHTLAHSQQSCTHTHTHTLSLSQVPHTRRIVVRECRCIRAYVGIHEINRCGHYFCEKCALARHQKSKKCAICGENTMGLFSIAKKLIAKLEEKTREQDEEEEVSEAED